MAEAQLQSLTWNVILTAVETLQGVPGITGKNVTNDAFNVGPTRFNSASDPPHTRVSPSTQTMTGAEVVIDLTAAPGTQDDVDATGLKLQKLLVVNRGAASVTIAAGAADGYDLFGAGNEIELPAGGVLAMSWDDNAPDVAATDKNIGLTGTAADEVDVLLIFG